MASDRPSGEGGEDLDRARERLLESLTRAYVSDQIPVEEYERRAGLLQKAGSHAELATLVADLPGALPSGRPPQTFGPGPRPDGVPPAAATRSAPTAGYTGHGSQQDILCVMGDRHLQGNWLQGDKAVSFTMMGSTRLDLRNVALPPGPIHIQAFVLMGETRVIVPRNLPVRLNATPFMGDATARRDVDQNVRYGEPHVIIEGFVMMGSLVVVAED